ncbi:MAG: hypothetical protein ISR79_00375 [Nitrosopumilus sp.]|nr:hypothetical protein [Nitrosopumilus sp.]
MTLEIKSYTDSALSDLFKRFFNRYKENNDFKYVGLIDSKIIQSKIIEIDYNDFNDEIKVMLEKEPKDRIHFALYRAIGEVFQIRHGSAELTERKQENAIQFELINSDLFDKVCSNPNLVHYENYDEDKIDKVADLLQKRNKFVTLRNTEEILLYNGKIYDNLQAETLIKEQTEILIPNCTKHHTAEVVSKIKRQTYTEIEKFDIDPNLITLENGILNLETLELKPHTPEHLSRVLLPVEYQKPIHEDIEENLKDTLFWQFLTNSFTINGKFRKDDFETVLEIIASPIIKRHVDEKAFMFLGGGENGKSVCLGYIESLIGKTNVSSITLQDISDDKFMRANLAGKSANIFSDLEQNELRHTGKIKAITSNEGIEVQKKHQQGFTLYPFCKLMFSCNRFPKVFDQTQGFFRRWIIVKWERNFENDPARIEYLKEKLADNIEEKNKVFSCLVGIANRLNKVGKFTHSKDWKTIQKEWNENADPIDSFDSEYIIDSEDHKTVREVYHFYKEKMLEKGETPYRIGQFGKAFAEYHDQDRAEVEGRTQRVWLNIGFKQTIQTTFKETDSN